MTHTSFPIRRAGPDDVDDLSRIGQDTFTETFGHLYTPENLHSFLQESHSAEWYSYALRQPDVACWIVKGETGAPMAYAVAGPNTLPVEVSTPEAGEVKRVYVRQEAQGLGLGGQLLAACLNWLQGRFQPLYVGVYADNLGAQRLYQRHGFHKVGEYIFLVGEHEDREFILMRPAVLPVDS